jgi:hypothetical protein
VVRCDRDLLRDVLPASDADATATLWLWLWLWLWRLNAVDDAHCRISSPITALPAAAKGVANAGVVQRLADVLGGFCRFDRVVGLSSDGDPCSVRTLLRPVSPWLFFRVRNLTDTPERLRDLPECRVVRAKAMLARLHYPDFMRLLKNLRGRCICGLLASIAN